MEGLSIFGLKLEFESEIPFLWPFGADFGGDATIAAHL